MSLGDSGPVVRQIAQRILSADPQAALWFCRGHLGAPGAVQDGREERAGPRSILRWPTKRGP